MNTENRNPDGLDKILSALFRRRKAILVPVLVLGLTALLAARVMPRVYKASTKVHIKGMEDVNPFLKDLVIVSPFKERMTMIEAVIKSRRVVEKLLDHLGVDASRLSPLERSHLVKSYAGRIKAYYLGGGLVQISYEDRTSEKAYEGIRFLADSFIQESLTPQKASVGAASDFLDEQIGRLRNELDVAEKKLQDFKKEHAQELPQVYDLDLSTLMNLRKDLMEAQAEQAAAARERDFLSARLSDFDPSAARLDEEIASVKSELARARSIYKRGHPVIAGLKSRLRRLEKEAGGAKRTPYGPALEKGAPLTDFFEDNPLRGTVRNGGQGGEASRKSGEYPARLLDATAFREADVKASSLEARIQEIQKKINGYEEKMSGFPALEKEFQGLMGDVETRRNIYNELRRRYEESVVTRELELFEEAERIRIIEPAIPPAAPIKPNQPLTVLFGLLGGLGLGLFLAMLLERLDRSVRSVRELEESLGLPVLGRLPNINSLPQ